MKMTTTPRRKTMPGRKLNPGVDAHAARELELFIENDAEIYRRRATPIVENLIKKKLAGTYDSRKAPQIMKYLVEDGAKKYAKDFGGTWNSIFNVPTRKAVAVGFAREFDSSYNSGEFDHMVSKLAPVAYRGIGGSRLRNLAAKKSGLPKVRSKAQAAKLVLGNPTKLAARKANPIIGAKHGEGEWKVIARGNSWWVWHPTKKAKRIGAIGGPRGKGRGINYFDRAMAEAEKRNKALAAKRRNPVARKPVHKAAPARKSNPSPASHRRKAEAAEKAMDESNKRVGQAVKNKDWEEARRLACISAKHAAVASKEYGHAQNTRKAKYMANWAQRIEAHVGYGFKGSSRKNPAKKAAPARKSNPKRRVAKRNPRRLAALTKI